MARPRKLKPDYCRDKSSGRAFVTLNGHRRYIGDHSSQASRDEYDRVVGEWISAGRVVVTDNSRDADGVTVSEIIAAFWTHALTYYSSCVRPDGKVMGELDNYRLALKPLRRLYGVKPATSFGPLALKSLRDEMIKLGWCRHVINRQILRVKSVFKWGVGNELLEPRVYEGLRAVAGLRAGKSDARETAPIKPVDENHAKAIFDHISPQVKALVELQALTGMRPGEACIMRGCDIDTSGKPWKYRPASHKTAHHGHERIIDLGPQARVIVEKFLKPDLQAYLFSPADSAASWQQFRTESRKTPLTCGNVPTRKHRKDQTFAPYFDVHAYRRAIARACAEAFPPPKQLVRQRVPAKGRKKKATRWETPAEWRVRLGKEQWQELVAWERKHRFHPHQLRHAAATRWRREFGAEATLVLLGDKTTRMVDVYAERDRGKAAQIAEKIG